MNGRAETWLPRLLDISRMMMAQRELPQLLEMIMNTMLELSDAERGVLLVYHNGHQHTPTIAVARDFDGDALNKVQKTISQTVLKTVLQTRKPLVIQDASADRTFDSSESLQRHHIRSVCAVPIFNNDDILTILYLDHSRTASIFTDDDLVLFQSFASQAATAIINARLFEENTALHRQMEETISKQDEEIQQNRLALQSRTGFDQIVGTSTPMQELFQTLRKVAPSPFPVLIHGESGTGKERVARAIHAQSTRNQRPFVSIDCGAIPDNILESELFGYVKGAFTGADRDKPGLLEAADTGTLFLDEIASMSNNMQQSLLRVIQESEFRRVGGQQLIQVDVRIVAACNVDLLQQIEDALFREDLYYRLNVLPIHLPPLRERRDDIVPLTDHFLTKLAQETPHHPKTISSDALGTLLEYHWPGNVRELENVLRLAFVMSEGTVIQLSDIRIDKRKSSAETTGHILKVEDYIQETYLRCRPGMDIGAIAQALGLSRKALWERRKKWEHASSSS